MTLREVKAGLIKLLKTKYPASKYKYYSAAVVEGYERPCFFTQLRPTSVENININTRKNKMSFYITFMQKKVDEAACLDMIEEIRDLFGLAVQIGDRAIDVTDFSWDFIGTERNTPEIEIRLEWFDAIEHKETTPIMQVLEIRKENIMED